MSFLFCLPFQKGPTLTGKATSTRDSNDAISIIIPVTGYWLGI